MKTLRSTLLMVLSMNQFSICYANNPEFVDMNFGDMIEESITISKQCSGLNNPDREKLLDKISGYMNEVEYRCNDVEKASDKFTSCTLTKFRLKTEYINCNQVDTYYSKVGKFLR